MLDGIASLMNFLADKNNGLLKKIELIIIVLSILFLIDNLIGFTYFYGVNNKIDGITKLEALIKSDSISRETKAGLISMEAELIERKNILKVFFDFTFSTFSGLISGLATNPYFGSSKEYYNRSEFWHILSSAGVFMAMAFVTLFFPLFASKKVFTIHTFTISILISLFLYFLSSVFIKALLYIEVINGNPWYNYTLNIAIQSIVIWVGSYYGKKSINRFGGLKEMEEIAIKRHSNIKDASADESKLED